jgi:hypothetical protein
MKKRKDFRKPQQQKGKNRYEKRKDFSKQQQQKVKIEIERSRSNVHRVLRLNDLFF